MYIKSRFFYFVSLSGMPVPWTLASDPLCYFDRNFTQRRSGIGNVQKHKRRSDDPPPPATIDKRCNKIQNSPKNILDIPEKARLVKCNP